MQTETAVNNFNAENASIMCYGKLRIEANTVKYKNFTKQNQVIYYMNSKIYKTKDNQDIITEN